MDMETEIKGFCMNLHIFEKNNRKKTQNQFDGKNY